MRLIGTLDDERKALNFSQFLQQKGIPHQIEIQTDSDWGSTSYGLHKCLIWINEEDHMEEAMKWYQLFLEDSENPTFQSVSSLTQETYPPDFSPKQNLPPPTPTETTWEKQPMGWVTRTLLIICCALFFFSHFLMPTPDIPKRYTSLILFTSPIEKGLLYDYPKFYQLIDRFVQEYGYENLVHPKDNEAKEILQKINSTPYWPGFYQLMLKGGWQAIKNGLFQYPTFEKIRGGQIWRLFSPCLLHQDLFHLFFNMIWLIVLGKQMEQRLKPLRYVLFILLVGVVSNTCQYLMSGPNFIGFSGILCGMLAFIWVRQKKAAWEGYQIDRLTLIFMLIFIIGMALLQFISFFLEKSFELAFSPNIANVAHLTGGIMGYVLARCNFFSWRHS